MCSNIDGSSVDGVIVISLDEFHPEHVIKKILGVENLPHPLFYKGIEGYEWKMDTKYYSATVNLYCLPEEVKLATEFCEKIKAIVIYFDGKKPSSFEDLLEWMHLLKDISSEVQLLICETCENDDTRSKFLNWCIENSYELIEINPPEESDNEDDGMSSKSGFGRVIEALQSQTWSNLVMKKNTNEESNLASDKKDDKSTFASCASSLQTADLSKVLEPNEEDLLLKEQVQNVFSNDDPGEEFEALFERFAKMKEKASNLKGEDRKKYAEEVAIAFWKAMGGPEDEIEGLDDEE